MNLDDDTVWLSYRSMRCLQTAGLETVAEVMAKTDEELLAIPTFGAVSLREVRLEMPRAALSERYFALRATALAMILSVQCNTDRPFNAETVLESLTKNELLHNTSREQLVNLVTARIRTEIDAQTDRDDVAAKAHPLIYYPAWKARKERKERARANG